jgi:hypothetical protein
MKNSRKSFGGCHKFKPKQLFTTIAHILKSTYFLSLSSFPSKARKRMKSESRSDHIIDFFNLMSLLNFLFGDLGLQDPDKCMQSLELSVNDACCLGSFIINNDTPHARRFSLSLSFLRSFLPFRIFFLLQIENWVKVNLGSFKGRTLVHGSCSL